MISNLLSLNGVFYFFILYFERTFYFINHTVNFICIKLKFPITKDFDDFKIKLTMSNLKLAIITLD